MKRIFTLIFLCGLLLTHLHLSAESRKAFVKKYKDIAIREMERTGIPASITLAQGILESGCGKSELALNANNHFGIKCHDWKGATYHMDDDKAKECFRKYETIEESWIDHSNFLVSRPRYAGLFQLAPDDYKSWAKGLKAAGYATNPQYAELLIKIIEEEELYKYDQINQPISKEEQPNIPIDEVASQETSAEELANYRNREEIINGLTCIQAVAGDSFDKIAQYYGIKLKKLLNYNDKTENTLQPGEWVFLKRKKTKAARGYEFHRVKEGETLHQIAQQYGVRLKKLHYYNYLPAGTTLVTGEKIFLRKKTEVH